MELPDVSLGVILLDARGEQFARLGPCEWVYVGPDNGGTYSLRETGPDSQANG